MRVLFAHCIQGRPYRHFVKRQHPHFVFRSEFSGSLKDSTTRTLRALRREGKEIETEKVLQLTEFCLLKGIPNGFLFPQT